ncbi:unnamed protein product [Anisakis simplex]|uniref:Integrase catalytic domain-containing protein n=1 Tax=Anisakis simplex TaxID=6269 RepID=A0A0M3J645_ANISI|nr:unnamed protein product [Anisakis simplex]
MIGKSFFQKLWKEKWEWDEVLPDYRANEWRNLMKLWAQHPNFNVPRLILTNHNNHSVSLHAFVDASNLAYATCIYLREGENHNEGKVQLIYAKNRLNPIRELTIPRLELMAALIGTRALQFVEHELGLVVTSKCIWSDAKCVLTWLSSTRALPVFVANRIREIKASKNVEYRHVSTNENPADIATRGTDPENLARSAIWWNGPEWLKLPKKNWPQLQASIKNEVKAAENSEPPCEDTQQEETRLTVNAVIQNHNPSVLTEDIIERIATRVNSWRKLKGVADMEQQISTRALKLPY